MTKRQRAKMMADTMASMAMRDRRRAQRHAVRVANGTAAKPRPTCTCSAYAFPHRPRSGLCRWPDPPVKTFPHKASRHAPSLTRLDNSSIRRRLADKYGWHPIQDRDRIRRWMPKVYIAYCRRHAWTSGFLWAGTAMQATAESRLDYTLPLPTLAELKQIAEWGQWRDMNSDRGHWRRRARKEKKSG